MSEIIFSPYLNFAGNCEEVMNYYKGVFDGECTMMRFGESQPMPGMENAAEKIMHADFKSEYVNFMASDGGSNEGFSNYQMSLSGTDGEKLRGFWNVLSGDGSITDALEKAPWGDEFGMLTDKFGVRWMVNISAA